MLGNLPKNKTEEGKKKKSIPNAKHFKHDIVKLVLSSSTTHSIQKHPFLFFLPSSLLPLLPLYSSSSPSLSLSPILGKTFQIREIRITSSILTLHILTRFLYSPEICVVAVGFFDAFELCE